MPDPQDFYHDSVARGGTMVPRPLEEKTAADQSKRLGETQAALAELSAQERADNLTGTFIVGVSLTGGALVWTLWGTVSERLAMVAAAVREGMKSAAGMWTTTLRTVATIMASPAAPAAGLLLGAWAGHRSGRIAARATFTACMALSCLPALASRDFAAVAVAVGATTLAWHVPGRWGDDLRQASVKPLGYEIRETFARDGDAFCKRAERDLLRRGAVMTIATILAATLHQGSAVAGLMASGTFTAGMLAGNWARPPIGTSRGRTRYRLLLAATASATIAASMMFNLV